MPTKVLYVGDPHARPDCLDEMQRLVDYCYDIVAEEKCQYILFTGDQYHTHSIINLAVMAFWQRAFSQLSSRAAVIALVGNHDKSGVTGDDNNAMMLHQYVKVIAEPELSPWGALLVPYIHDAKEFVRVCQAFHHLESLVCHQTFDGSKYENGFYASDGVDPNLIPQKHVISGHIHTPQEFGKVWYPGSPRWQTVADANTERAVWVVEHADDGTILNRKPYPTKDVCKAIYRFEDRGELVDANLASTKATVYVDVFGTELYVKERQREYEDRGWRVRTFPETNRTMKVKESDGLAVAFTKFVEAYAAKNQTPPTRLLELAKTRIAWLSGEA
jgi:DNA repair exonuclease SbcCD nuclease subunit